MIVTARDLTEVAEGGGLLGVRAGRFGGGIAGEPEAVSSCTGGETGRILKDTRNGKN